MEPISFVQNQEDLSTDRGFQFKFFCDRCQNGYLSSYEASSLGVATGLLQAASGLLGDVFGRAADTAYEVQRAVGGKAHDEALRRAVQEMRSRFKQCKRCGQWVCPEVCWNGRRQLCVECAPVLEQEAAAAQAQVAKDQVFERARGRNLVADVDMGAEASAACPACGADVGTAKFCGECGERINPTVECEGCGASVKATAKFCGECGHRRT